MKQVRMISYSTCSLRNIDSVQVTVFYLPSTFRIQNFSSEESYRNNGLHLNNLRSLRFGGVVQTPLWQAFYLYIYICIYLFIYLSI